LNTIELAQASRLFARRNLRFLVADVFRLPFLPGTFDVIVLASIIQYFEDLPRLVQALQPVLSESGEIHLLDSPLYEAGELAAARQRTRHYYHSLGFPEMAGYYHHHPISTLEAFSPRWLYRPNTRLTRLKRRLGQLASPFPWICLRKKSPDAYPLD
jgi:ubiquinone/menaquinone biosynthesis C-methylase UbiE